MFKKKSPKQGEESTGEQENGLQETMSQWSALTQPQAAAQQNIWQAQYQWHAQYQNQIGGLMATLSGGADWGNWTASTSSTPTHVVSPGYYPPNPSRVMYEEVPLAPTKQKKIEEDPDIYAALDLFSKEKRRQEEAKVA